MEYVSAVSELNYMTQVVIMLYEDPTKVIHFFLLYFYFNLYFTILFKSPIFFWI